VRVGRGGSLLPWRGVRRREGREFFASPFRFRRAPEFRRPIERIAVVCYELDPAGVCVFSVGRLLRVLGVTCNAGLQGGECISNNQTEKNR
jgi:hypothetical protein